MSDRKFGALLYVGAIIMSSLVSAYMTFLRAPAVIEVRPGLAEVGFWTALFSGRFISWLFHTSPVAGAVITCLFWVGMVTVLIATT
jgi:hypothetical protein